jgi:uncharacterized RDD family membrane protein YckC
VAKRAFISPDFFSVARELVGLPLASPNRRALAILIDGILIAILAKAGGLFLGLAAVFVLIRASRRGERGGFLRESVRLAVRVIAGLVLFLVMLKLWNTTERGFRSAEQAITARTPVSTNPERECTQDSPEPDPEPAPATLQDSLSARIKMLEARNERLDNERDCLQASLNRARNNRGIRSYVGGVFDDLGVGFGWAAIYFTGFLAIMRGQTPGKRLMRIRVIRLDGKPLTWWMSFERFGGYAASFSVGLLGFLQILWDRNRMGLHDKVCETVVVLDNPQAAARS